MTQNAKQTFAEKAIDGTIGRLSRKHLLNLVTNDGNIQLHIHFYVIVFNCTIIIIGYELDLIDGVM